MKRLFAIALISMPLAACFTPGDPAQTGAVVGGATGAAVGGAATERVGGAVVGGAIGAATGAAVGAASARGVRCRTDTYEDTQVCYPY
jgi:osmotically inducible lipoprotein OsmB